MPHETSGPDPTVRKRRLRNELRKARERAGKTQRDVAQAMDWSSSKLIRIETGTVNISTNDLRALLNLYEVQADRIGELVELARAARETPRWSIYKDVASTAYIAFLGYESSAGIIRNFEPMLMPGLLQTEEYARAVLEVIERDKPPQRIDALVDLRIQRQEILHRQPSDVQFHFIVDEAVLHRMIGGPDVMRHQLLHLREVAGYPNVSLRVVPFSTGMYRRLRVPYVLFEFPDDQDEDVLYLENPMGEYIIKEDDPEEQDDVGPAHFLAVFWELEQIAPKSAFIGVVDDALARLAGASSTRSA